MELASSFIARPLTTADADACALLVNAAEWTPSGRDMLTYCLGSGFSEGAFTLEGSLVGLLLAIPYHKYRCDMEEQFNSIFSIDGENTPYSKNLHKPLLSLPDKEIVYIRYIAVSPAHRRLGIESYMVKELMRRSCMTMAAKLSYGGLRPIFKSLGFSLTNMGKGRALAIKRN